MSLFKATPINDDYHHGMLGQFNIIIRTKDDYVNITKLCKKGGKEFKLWKRTDKAKQTLDYYDRVYLDCDEDDEPSPDRGMMKKEYHCLDIVDNIPGVAKEIMGIIKGSYVPKELALKVWDWVDVFKYKTVKKNGFIYIITNDVYIKNNWYKIGLTTNIDNRLKGLQTASPIPMKAIFSKEFENVKDIESTIHDTYTDVRMEGEWFELEDLQECIDYINSL
jgi:hypothetical protein